MDDNRKYNNHDEQDLFDKLVGSRLDGHRMPVDEDCWAAIEEQIKPKSKNKIWFYIGSAAAIIAVLLFVVNPFRDLDDDAAINVVAEVPISISEDKEYAHETGESPNEKTDIQEDNKSGVKVNKQQQIISAHDKTFATTTTEKQETTTIIDSIEKGGHEEFITDNTVNQKEEFVKSELTDSIDSKARKLTYEDYIDKLLAEQPHIIEKKKTEHNWTLGLLVNSGGGISNLNGNQEFTYNTDHGGDYTKPPGNLESSLTNTDWDVDYKLPISVGFLVKKNFGQTFSLESGLIYTYLSSDMKKEVSYSTESMKMKGSVQLHYLGIPLNVVANFWTDRKWSIYGSAGMMIEKGIRMNEKMSTYKNSIKVEDNHFSKNWIHGSQWSINGAVGVSYKLAPSWEIYLEPRVSYYFDNKQPASMRTEKPTMINLNAGIKFNLK